MTSDQRKKLSEIKQFKQLIAYLRDEMGWPINSESAFDELTYEYTTTELGIDDKSAAQIQEIKRLRPLSAKQPWGVFFVKFEPKKLPVVALRRILGQVALKKRASANPADRTMWAQEDLLFISNYGEGDDRQITLAHFSVPTGGHTLPSLKVLGWDSKDTVLHLEAVARELTEQLSWPADESDVDAWRAKWRSAFTVGHQEVITTSKALSIRLAQLARDIRDRISTALTIETADGPLTKLMKAFQESLIHDLTADDFADMYAQTIAYGLLSSRIADPKKKSADDLAVHMRLSPFLQELMEAFFKIGGSNSSIGLDFDELGIGEVVSLLDRANMEAVVADFGDRNPQEDPVIHFYEEFLKQYDADKRMSRGVFYTPRPVVTYIVRSVDKLLRTEFGLSDGLADTTTWGEMARRNKGLQIPDNISPDQDFVQILDPATGTGTFLVEAIEIIHGTLVSKWRGEGHNQEAIDQLWNEYVPKHLLTRLYGYELMMAPYAIAHLKISLKLSETRYKFNGAGRAQVYLTNSLEPASKNDQTLTLSLIALAHEANEVNNVKRNTRFTVVIGNPPYSSISQNWDQDIWAKVNEYLILPDGPIVERGHRNHLQDDYVKFIRYSQSCIQDSTIGVIGMITNSSYLAGAWYRGMRYHLQNVFPTIKIMDLHGGKGFIRSAGASDENVFDILQSVAIVNLVRSPSLSIGCQYEEIIGSREDKYQRLTSGQFNPAQPLQPMESNRWSFKPMDIEMLDEWRTFTSIEDVFLQWGEGAETSRDGLAIAFNPTELEHKLDEFAGTKISDQDLEGLLKFKSNKSWDTGIMRERFRRTGFDRSHVTPYTYRPFDNRYIYWEKSFVSTMRGEKLKDFRSTNNVGFLFSRATTKDDYTNFYVTEHIPDKQVMYNSKVAPLWRSRDAAEIEGLFGETNESARQSNFTDSFLADWASRFSKSDANTADPVAVFHFIYAVVHSRGYRRRYYSLLASDYPRIPFVSNVPLYTRLSELGQSLVETHLLKNIDNATSHTQGFGEFGQAVTSPRWEFGRVLIDRNGAAGFEGVPKDVWEYEVGSHQVCEKWLKDRKGRSLSEGDVAQYKSIVQAISKTIETVKAVDEVINLHGGWPGAFQPEVSRARKV